MSDLRKRLQCLEAVRPSRKAERVTLHFPEWCERVSLPPAALAILSLLREPRQTETESEPVR